MVVDTPPEDIRARLSAHTSALTRGLHHPRKTRRDTTSSSSTYSRDKSLSVFRGKCRASRRATYSSTFRTTSCRKKLFLVTFREAHRGRHEPRWNRKMSLVISRWRSTRLGERDIRKDEASRKKILPRFLSYTTEFPAPFLPAFT